MIDVHRSDVPFWLHGVAGADLRPDSALACNAHLPVKHVSMKTMPVVHQRVHTSVCTLAPALPHTSLEEEYRVPQQWPASLIMDRPTRAFFEAIQDT
jgi:hypothetical protein